MARFFWKRLDLENFGQLIGSGDQTALFRRISPDVR